MVILIHANIGNMHQISLPEDLQVNIMSPSELDLYRDLYIFA